MIRDMHWSIIKWVLFALVVLAAIPLILHALSGDQSAAGMLF